MFPMYADKTMNAVSVFNSHNSLFKTVESRGFHILPLLYKNLSEKVIEYPDISSYEKQSYKTLMAFATNVPIERASPKYSYGKVISFEVLPRLNPDPTIVFAIGVDLTEYYKFWGMAVSDNFPFSYYLGANRGRDKKIKLFDNIVMNILQKADGILSFNESLFMAVELLKLKNEVLL